MTGPAKVLRDERLIPDRAGELLPPHRLSLFERFRLWLAHPFHRWATVKDTGVYLYEHCTTCGERRAYRHAGGGGYQPIDRQWVTTGEWFSWHNPKPTAGSGAQIPRNQQHPADPRPRGIIPDRPGQEVNSGGDSIIPPMRPDNRPLWPDLYGEDTD